ncbi:MAG: Gfo/Idh/MocA family oxidoreductase [Parvibaculum sp.]|nr:Gfo/Idh/MocA family oxidoreductase [Parvibaculum sp.]
MSAQKIRLGMVGGGKGSMIGDIHRIGAAHSGGFELVAGALSSTKARSDASAAAAGIAADRSYASFDEMAAAEAARADGIEAVAILTPNALHAAAVEAFARNGVHIICEKPMTGNLAEAQSLAATVTAANVAFVLAHSYTAFAMVRRARELITAGTLGDIRTIHSSYLQDGRVAYDNDAGAANWHLDPAMSGVAGTLGDIGSHAFHITTWLTGLELESVAADLSAFGIHNKLDNDGNALLRFKGGAKGNLSCSQMAIGKGNGFAFFIYGSKASLGWSVENPSQLHLTLAGKPTETLTPDDAELAELIHFEAQGFGSFAPYASAFSRLYTDSATLIRARQLGKTVTTPAPDLAQGLAVMQFIDAAVRSSADGASWVKV